MKLARTSSCLLVLLLTAAGTRGADPAAKESNDTLDTARRELQELPAIERGLTPMERRPESTLPLPLFTPVAPQAPASSLAGEEDLAKPVPSQGWLLDALRKTEAQDRTRSKALWGDDRLSSNAARGKAESAPNPLGNYLQQWLSPGDQKLLGGEKLRSTPLEHAGIHSDEPFRGAAAYDAKPLLSNARPHLPMVSERVNPYLTPAPSEDSLVPEPLAPLPPGSNARTTASTLSNPGTDSTMYPPPWDTAPTLSGSTKPQSVLPPPTAPLVDEHRYFPQLRRF